MQEGKQKGASEDEDDLDDEEEDADAPPKPIRTTFELNDTLFAEAELEETDQVFIWLGVRTSASAIVTGR